MRETREIIMHKIYIKELRDILEKHIQTICFLVFLFLFFASSTIYDSAEREKRNNNMRGIKSKFWKKNTALSPYIRIAGRKNQELLKFHDANIFYFIFCFSIFRLQRVFIAAVCSES